VKITDRHGKSRYDYMMIKEMTGYVIIIQREPVNTMKQIITEIVYMAHGDGKRYSKRKENLTAPFFNLNFQHLFHLE
jgi:hypothetical protein